MLAVDVATPSSSTTEVEPEAEQAAVAEPEAVEAETAVPVKETDNDVSISEDDTAVMEGSDSYTGPKGEPTLEELEEMYDIDDPSMADDDDSSSEPSTEEQPGASEPEPESDTPLEATPDDPPQEQAEPVSRLTLNDQVFAAAKSLGLSERVTRSLHAAGELEAEMGDRIGSRPGQTSPDSVVEQPIPQEIPLPEGLDPDLYDKEVVDAFKAQQRQTAALQQQNAAMGAASARRRFEDCVNSLDGGWHEVFGEGAGASAPRLGTTHDVNRTAVFNEMDVMVAGMRHKGTLGAINFEQVFDRALNAVFGDHKTKMATNNLKSKVEKRESQILPKAKSTQPHKLTGRQAAIRRVAEMQKEGDWHEDDEDDPDFEI